MTYQEFMERTWPYWHAHTWHVGRAARIAIRNISSIEGTQYLISPYQTSAENERLFGAPFIVDLALPDTALEARAECGCVLLRMEVV